MKLSEQDYRGTTVAAASAAMNGKKHDLLWLAATRSGALCGSARRKRSAVASRLTSADEAPRNHLGLHPKEDTHRKNRKTLRFLHRRAPPRFVAFPSCKKRKIETVITSVAASIPKACRWPIAARHWHPHRAAHR